MCPRPAFRPRGHGVEESLFAFSGARVLVIATAVPLSIVHSRNVCHSERSVSKVLPSEIGLAISVGTHSRGISLRFCGGAAACVNFVAHRAAIFSRPWGFFLPQLHIFSGASIPSRSSAVTNCRSGSDYRVRLSSSRMTRRSVLSRGSCVLRMCSRRAVLIRLW
jgi:hypothetical protein